MFRSLSCLVLLLVAPSAFGKTAMLAGQSAARGTIQRIAKARQTAIAAGGTREESFGWVRTHSPEAAAEESWAHGSSSSAGSLWSTTPGREDSARVVLDVNGNVRASTSVSSKIGKDGVVRHHVTTERFENGQRIVVRGPVRVVEPSETHRANTLAKDDNGFVFASSYTGLAPHGSIVQSIHHDAEKAVYASAAHESSDLAFGRELTSRRTTLDSFAGAVGGSMYRTWGVRGLSHVGSWNRREFAAHFHDALTTAVRRGGRLKFDVTDVDVQSSLASKADVSEEGTGVTAWELRQVLGNPSYRAAAEFYVQEKRGFRKLTEAEEHTRGLRP